MGKNKLKTDVFCGEDRDIGGDMPKKFQRIMKASNTYQIRTSPSNSKPSIERVLPGESFTEYNLRLSEKSSLTDTSLNNEIYLKPSILAALQEVKSTTKPMRTKRKEYLQKRKEKKHLRRHNQMEIRRNALELHQSAIRRPLKDVVKEPPKLIKRGI